MLKKYLLNTSGNFSIIMSIVIATLFIGAGAAIDMLGATSEKSTLQNMSDAAVLAAVSSGEDQIDQLKTIAENHLHANNTQELNFDWELIPDGDEVILRVTSLYGTKMMGFVGQDTLDVSVLSAAPLSNAAAVNVSLVLDSTGSMEGANMAALKTATTNMVNRVEASGDDIQISVVPFGTYVNVGLENRNEPWINVPADYDILSPRRDIINENICTSTTETRTSDGITRASTRRNCPDAAYGPEYINARTYSWRGCVGSRNGLYRNFPEYSGQRIPAINQYDCATPMLPLTNNFGNIRGAINDMEANDETYIPAGLMWGWRTLDSRLPFDEASVLPGGEERLRALVLMSDGQNTKSKGPRRAEEIARPEADAFHEQGDGEETDEFTAELCESIKNDNIRMFVIAYRIEGAASASTHSTLRNCATSNSDFFNADSASELNEAFEAIGNSFSVVRLSR